MVHIRNLPVEEIFLIGIYISKHFLDPENSTMVSGGRHREGLRLMMMMVYFMSLKEHHCHHYTRGQ